MAETTRSSKPIFSRAANSKSVKDYLAQLDELTRRNKGGFSAVAEETGSSVPFMVPGRAVKSGVPEMPQRQVAQLPTPEEYQIAPQEPMVGEVQGAQDQGITAEQFVESINASQGGDQMYLTGTGSSGDGGTILTSGETIYPSGNIKTADGRDVYAWGSAPGGGLLYSDGKTRYIDPTTAGLEGLMEMIGLSGQTITQPYGNVNPGMGYKNNVHGGTDIRTRNLTNKAFSLPFEVQVLEVITADSGSPYGNSVLIGLPTGEAIRLSHLSDLGQFQTGGTIAPGSYIGTFGSTGNSDAEHLDLEYYNQEGQRSDPKTFQGLTNSEYLAPYIQPKETQNQSVPGQISSQPPQNQQPNQPVTQPQEQPIQNAQSTGMGGMEKLKQAADAFGYTANLANPSLSPEAKVVAKQESDKALTGIGFDPRGTIGAQELLMGDVPAAGREASQTIERKNLTPKVDLGISELLRGDVEGAKTVFKDTAGRVVNKVSEIIAPKVGAVESVPQQDPQADEGIKRLQTKLFGKGGSGVNLFSKPDPSDIGQQRAVGEQGSGSSLLPLTFSGAKDQQVASGKNDIRDPFFKSGMNEQYGVQDTNNGALSLDQFGSEFFQNPDNIQRVFGGTQFEAGANAKYQAYVEEKRRQEEEARRQQESNNNGSSGGNQGGQSNNNNQNNSSNQSSSQSSSNNRTANYATGNIAQQLSQPRQQPAPIYKPYQQTQELMRSVPNPQPQQNIFQKVATGASNLFKKWFQ